MTDTAISTDSQISDLRTETGSIDYAAYDRLARKKRALAYAATGRAIVAGFEGLIERARALITQAGHGATAH